MSLLFISHADLGHRSVIRMGMWGMAVAPALDLLLGDALAASCPDPQPAMVGAGPSPSATGGPLTEPSAEAVTTAPVPLEDVGVTSEAKVGASTESRVEDPKVAQALACLVVAGTGQHADEEPGDGPDDDPFSRVSHVTCDLGREEGAASLRDLVVEYVEHELAIAGDPGLLLAFDMRTKEGEAEAQQVRATLAEARKRLPEGFRARRIVVVEVLPDDPARGSMAPKNSLDWGAAVVLEVSDHTADANDRERIEDDEALAEVVALIACAVEDSVSREELFRWRRYDGDNVLVRHAAVGIRAVVAGQDTTGEAAHLALAMAGLSTHAANESAPLDMDPVADWPAQIGLEPAPLVARILTRPSEAGALQDMRDAFGDPQAPVWNRIDAGHWILTLRDLRRQALLGTGMALATRARENAEEWRTEILGELEILVDRVVEHGFASLPDAELVLEEFDDALSRATVETGLRHPEGTGFDAALADLRAEVELLPHAAATRTRFGLAGAALAVLPALTLPVMRSTGLGVATRIVVLLVGIVVGLVVAAAYQRARERRLIAARERVLASLGAWLVADMEQLVANEVARGVRELREAMAGVHLPAVRRFLDAHVEAESILGTVAASDFTGRRAKSIAELTSLEAPPREGPDASDELHRFMRRDRGRQGWRSAESDEVSKRLLLHARAAVLPSLSLSLEDALAELADAPHRGQASQGILGFLAQVDREKVIDRRRMRGWSEEALTLLLASHTDNHVWAGFTLAPHKLTWIPVRPMALSLQLQWKEKTGG